MYMYRWGRLGEVRCRGPIRARILTCDGPLRVMGKIPECWQGTQGNKTSKKPAHTKQTGTKVSEERQVCEPEGMRGRCGNWGGEVESSLMTGRSVVAPGAGLLASG